MTTAARLRDIAGRCTVGGRPSIEQLEALCQAADQLEALQADKARLDWLEQKGWINWLLAQRGYEGHTCRQAIDAAMRQSAQKEDK